MEGNEAAKCKECQYFLARTKYVFYCQLADHYGCSMYQDEDRERPEWCPIRRAKLKGGKDKDGVQSNQ